MFRIFRYPIFRFDSIAIKWIEIEQWKNLSSLTELMKKSLWNQETIPKFVRRNILSMIHMMLRQAPLWPSRAAIINGTSEVDWWLISSSDLSLMRFSISSPISTTTPKRITIRPLQIRWAGTYLHSRHSNSRCWPSIAAIGTRSFRWYCMSLVRTTEWAIVWASRDSEWEYNTDYSRQSARNGWNPSHSAVACTGSWKWCKLDLLMFR